MHFAAIFVMQICVTHEGFVRVLVGDIQRHTYRKGAIRGVGVGYIQDAVVLF